MALLIIITFDVRYFFVTYFPTKVVLAVDKVWDGFIDRVRLSTGVDNETSPAVDADTYYYADEVISPILPPDIMKEYRLKQTQDNS